MSPLTAWRQRHRDPPRVQSCTLPVPPPINNRLRPGKTTAGQVRLFLSRESRGYKKQCELLTLKLVPHLFPARVRIRLVWLLGPGERGDLDNRIKPVLDVLKGRAYQDDRQVAELHVYAEPSGRPHGSMHVTITRMRDRR